MVTAKTQYNLKNAREYFEEHLCVGDYYDEGQRVAGEWVGVGAERLGLSGKVRADDFLRLCDNQHPGTGEKLTQRQNTTRTEGDKNTANRRIFYDFTFSPPKSVSLVGFLGNDERIFEAHARAVQAALKDFEAFAATRVRVGGVRSERLTGNFVASQFTHDTSRAIDPHLHTHCIVFNATFDAVENRWKALENYELLRARKFAENIYYYEFARDLKAFGYRIRNRPRGDFEIEGVSEELCRRFSKRDAEIDAALAKLLADHPELGGANIAELRAKLATEKRTRKQKDLSRDELRTLWEAQLSKSEQASLRQLSEQQKHDAKEEKRIGVGEAVQWAEEHLFDRNSVVLECQLWQEALGRARGESFSVSELKDFTQRRGYIRDEARPGEVTLREVLLREWEIVQTAKQGVADCHTLVANPQTLNPKLDDEQRKALDALLGSTDRISIFRGGAGTGKSFVLRDLVEQVQQAGRRVVVLAPQRQQVVDMEKAGLPSPSTIASFLLKREVVSGALIVVDEAGQIGGRQMLELLRLAREKNARVILSGDTRQHGAVETSDALLAIERHSGVKPVELHTIRRQDPALARTAAERTRIGDVFARQRVRLSPQERFQRTLQREATVTGQAILGLDFDATDQTDSPSHDGFFNIHHALKAHAMRTGFTTQLVWESTLKDSNPASVAWNLFTALYYKAGNNPWRLQSLPDNTCYVGVSFFKESPRAGANMQTSLAQVFGAGEGIVLKGEMAVFNKERDRKPHLTEEGAEKLLARAIQSYTLQHNTPPKRVVVHKTSRYWPEELRGMRKALAGIYYYDFLALESRETRFMRVGKKPPLRGTVVQLGQRNYLIYCNGYVPYLRSFPGKRIPRPLEVIEHHGDSPAVTVCQEILALTKLNWNSCAFGSGIPITIRFARDVGKILTELPKDVQPGTKYKFYM